MSAVVIAVGSGLVGAVAGPLLLGAWRHRQRGQAVIDDLLADRRAGQAAANHARFARSVHQRAEFLAIAPVRVTVDAEDEPEEPTEDIPVEDWTFDELREWLSVHRNDDPPPPEDDEEAESDDEPDVDDAPDDPADELHDDDAEPAETP